MNSNELNSLMSLSCHLGSVHVVAGFLILSAWWVQLLLGAKAWVFRILGCQIYMLYYLWHIVNASHVPCAILDHDMSASLFQSCSPLLPQPQTYSLYIPLAYRLSYIGL